MLLKWNKNHEIIQHILSWIERYDCFYWNRLSAFKKGNDWTVYSLLHMSWSWIVPTTRESIESFYPIEKSIKKTNQHINTFIQTTELVIVYVCEWVHWSHEIDIEKGLTNRIFAMKNNRKMIIKCSIQINCQYNRHIDMFTQT